MQITAVEPQRHDPDRIAIFVDGDFAFGCHALVWLESGFHVGDVLAAADLEVMRNAEALRALVDRGVRLLTNRPRSRVELLRLLGRGTPSHPAPNPALVQAALAKLAEQGLLDDRAFAEFWVEQRDRFRPKGAQALRAELRGRGVGRDEIDATVAPERDLERALEAARHKAQQLAARPGMATKVFREQVGAFLQRRGFNYGVARAAVVALWEELGGTGDVRGEDDAED